MFTITFNFAHLHVVLPATLRQPVPQPFLEPFFLPCFYEAVVDHPLHFVLPFVHVFYQFEAIIQSECRYIIDFCYLFSVDNQY